MHSAKTTIVDEIKGWLNSSPFLIVTDYTGMTVAQFTELRMRLRAAGSELHVVKNTFIRRALTDAGLPDLEDVLKGQTAVVYGESDISAAAKAVKTFASEFGKPEIRAGILDRSALTADQVRTLADLPSRDVLLAQLLGVISAPATKLATMVNTPAVQLAQVIKAHAEKES